jgi:hypothetical protein
MSSSKSFEKSAAPNLKAIGKFLGNAAANTGGGLATQVFWDQVYHPDASIKDSLSTLTGKGEDKQRTLMSYFNALVGMAATGKLRKSTVPLGLSGQALDDAIKVADQNKKYGQGLMFSIPAKDALMAAGGLAADTRKNLPGIVQNLENITDKPQAFTNKDKLMAALIGAGALGVGAYGAHRISKSMDEQRNAANSGRVTLTLPTKDPNDVETQVSIPLSDAGVSAKTYSQLGRDVRRRLRGESKERKLAYIKAIEQGVDPDDAALMLSKSSADKGPISILANSHIKSIAKEHAPEKPEEAPEEVEEAPKQDDGLKQKVSEQEKRIKQLEKFLGQINGNKLSKVHDNLKSIRLKKTAYAPTLGEVQSTPMAVNTPGGLMGLSYHNPMFFGPEFQKLKSYVQPFLAQSENPFISRLFGKVKPSPDAIVPKEY